MIHFDNVTKRFGRDQFALQSVNLSINQGEMLFLTGHSGAGKSTLLRLIMCIDTASSGQVIVDGCDVAQLSREQIAYHRREIGVVFQDHQLLLDRTVFDNVALPLVVAGYPPQDIAKRVRAALDKVGLLAKENALPEYLSGGEQQRVGIARAVVHRPKILLADEPTGNLDPYLSNDIFNVFEQFNQAGVTVILASHDMSLIQSRSHRVITLQQGRLLAS